MKRTIEWYETKDKLPEPWITVLVSGGLAYYDPKSKTWHSRTGSDTGQIIEWPVTHWAEIPSIYDLPDEEIDVTITMYPSDMMKAGKCINPSDGKICEAPDLDFIEFWRRAREGRRKGGRMKTNKELSSIARTHPVCSCKTGAMCLACVMRGLADRLEAADAEIERLNQERQIILLDLHDKNAEIERLKGLLIFAWDYVNRGPALHLLDAEEWRWIRDLRKGQK